MPINYPISPRKIWLTVVINPILDTTDSMVFGFNEDPWFVTFSLDFASYPGIEKRR